MAQDQNEPDLFSDGQIKNEVLTLWAAVFHASNEIIRQSEYHGFLTIGIIPDPNIHQILKALKIVADILDMVLDDLEDTSEPGATESIRLIQNAKQQLLTMENIALSLRLNDEAAFNEHISCLKRQAPF